jgi:hypothetical protein
MGVAESIDPNDSLWAWMAHDVRFYRTKRNQTLVQAVRNAAYFGRAPTDYQSFEYAPAAAAALAQLDAEYATWLAGVEPLGETGLARPCGEAEGPHAERPLAALVLHINRELIHHLAEVCLLRDLHLHTHQQTRPEAS